ncbi:hypothetical protein ACLF3G_27675 [Falsiroseomonas sp. HC035]|uniref:hypothetical protein n=1 Tax=Falsiroseomonas sp. HC035 TaxID=3390999 RepID=UPI003D30FDAF
MSDALAGELAALLGASHVLTGAAAEPYLTDWRKLVRCWRRSSMPPPTASWACPR